MSIAMVNHHRHEPRKAPCAQRAAPAEAPEPCRLQPYSLVQVPKPILPAAGITPPPSPVVPRPPEQEQLLVIGAHALISPVYGRIPHVMPPLCPVSVLQEKPIGYGAFGVVWSVTDPRDGRKLALKKIPNVFHNVVSAKRAFRELNFLYHVRHENVVSIVSVLEEPNFPYEIYLLCDLMQTDLHRIIVSPQPLSADHVKIFLYQLLRGLKFLHSANILHRDIKPGNLLVNSDCKLKICDFGLARVDDPHSQAARTLTLEVVTQYYRAPELLMGALEYSAAIDIWSAGCIFAELLCRSILFQASNPLAQLDLIMDLLGSPDPSDLATACTAARRYVLRLPKRPPRLAERIWAVSRTATEEALHLLEHLLKFNPKQRASAAAALSHPYLDEARLRYHSCMCSCCQQPNERSLLSRCSRAAAQTGDPEPLCPAPMSELEEAAIADFATARLRLSELVQRINLLDLRNRSMPLLLNRQAANFRNFLKSSVAQASEMPPSPHRWEQR